MTEPSQIEPSLTEPSLTEQRVEKMRNRWQRRHPRLGAAFYLFGTLASVAFLVTGLSRLTQDGEPSVRLVLYTGFWALGTLVNALGTVRQVRLTQDSSADDTRLQAILDQPSDQRLRKARFSIWVLSAALVAVGAVMALTARPPGSHPVQLGVGCVLAVLGVALAARGEMRLRDPDVYL